jgi:hypothetical protein
MFVVAVMGFTVALSTALWGAWNPDELGATFVAVEAIGLLVGLAAVVAARGCFVEVRATTGELRDVVAWRTVRRIDQRRIEHARVQRGVWRWFELELDDGTRHLLVGASPAQFPARLLPGSAERDLADLDQLMGPDPTG